MLARSLTDEAREVFLQLPETLRTDLTSLDSCLLTSFGRCYNRREHARRLHDARQLATQSLREFARNIEQEATLAYREYPENIRQEHMVDAFVQGLHDPFARALLQREDFPTLCDALAAAERTSPPGPSKRVRVAQVEQPPAASAESSVLNVLLAKIASLEKRLQHRADESPSSKSCKTADGQTARRRDLVCFNCGIRGHFKAECRQRPKLHITCSKCNQKGHYHRLCKQSAQSAPTRVVAAAASAPSPQQPFVFHLVSNTAQDVKPVKQESGNL